MPLNHTPLPWKNFALALSFGALSSDLWAQTAPSPTGTNAQPATTLPEMVITGTPTGYAATQATTATKTDTPILEIPQSIQVVPEQLMKDQQTITLQEALDNVSGITKTSSPNYDGYTMRGFNAFSAEYLDGLRVEQGNAWFTMEPSMMQRVEVLKGPSSTLYGQGPLAGVINLVSKLPTADRLFDVDFTTGSYSLYQASADIGGPLNSNGSVSYRISGLYRYNDQYTPYVSKERVYISPAVTIIIDSDTKITFLGNYTHDRLGEFDGIPAKGLFLPNPNGTYARNLFPGEPGYYNEFPMWRTYFGYLFEHKFNENWTLRQNLRTSLADGDDSGVWVSDLQSNDRLIDRQFSPHFYHTDESITADTNLEGHFDAIGAKHTLLTGFDIIGQDVTRQYFGGQIAPLDIFDPHYGARGYDIINEGTTDIGNYLMGIYLQDQIKYFDKLSFLLAGRYGYGETSTSNDKDNSHEYQKFSNFTPRVGVSYEFVKGASWYASYGESFNPQTGTSFNNMPFSPETGQQWESGIKTALDDGKLVSTLAVYQLTRQNVLTTDPAHPQFSIETGEQRSRGVEYDLAWEIKKGWNLTASYAYTDSIVTKDNSLPVGTRVDDVGRNLANIWMSYQIQDGPLRGLGFGAGAHYVNGREGDMPNTFALPNYATVDAGLFFRRDRFRAQINVTNLLNKVYYASSYGGVDYVLPGDPISFRASVGWSF